MKVEIYHAKNTRDSFFYKEDGNIYNQHQALDAFKNDGYFLAGNLEVTGITNDEILENSFRLSQNLDKAWNGKNRSTSIGDIIKIKDALWIVAFWGMNQLA